MNLDEPYLIFDKLDVKDMKNLQEDIKIYLNLGKVPPLRKRYWEALLVFCDQELARRKEALDPEQPPKKEKLLTDERGIEADVKNLLERMSYGEIEELQSEI